jgi:hypothetical protein
MDATGSFELDGMLAEFDMRLVEKTMYMRVGTLPGAALSGDPELEAVVGQWFSASLEEIAELSGESIESSAEVEAALENAPTLADFVDAGALAFERPTVGQVDGELVRTYAVAVDAEAATGVIWDFVAELATTAEDREDIESFSPVVREVASAVSFEGVEVQVALLSGELRQISGRVVLDTEKIDEAAIADALAAATGEPVEYAREDEIPPGTVTVDFKVRYTAYNEPVWIIAPEESKPLVDLVGGALGSAGSAARDASKTALVAGLRTEAELYAYGKAGSYVGFCSSPRYLAAVAGDADGAEWLQCGARAEGYTFVGALGDGTYICTDETGLVERLPEPPSGPSCASN